MKYNAYSLAFEYGIDINKYLECLRIVFHQAAYMWMVRTMVPPPLPPAYSRIFLQTSLTKVNQPQARIAKVVARTHLWTKWVGDAREYSKVHGGGNVKQPDPLARESRLIGLFTVAVARM